MTHGRRHITWAVIEVLLAFAGMHVAFRAFAHFTAIGRAEYESGLNFSPGAAMLLVTLLLVALHRRRPAAWGLTSLPLRAGVNGGLACLLILVACSAAAIALGAPFERPPTSLAGASTRLGINLVCTGLTLWVLWRFGPAIVSVPVAIGVALIATAALLPVAAAALQGRTPGAEALTVLWVLAASGVGEEVFFRGTRSRG